MTRKQFELIQRGQKKNYVKEHIKKHSKMDLTTARRKS